MALCPSSTVTPRRHPRGADGAPAGALLRRRLGRRDVHDRAARRLRPGDHGDDGPPRPRRRQNRWLLNGSKWFCSNVDAKAIATLARPEGADPGLRGLALFLVPATRADGTPNSIRIKRVKDKMGTRSVPTAEVDFVDTEAYILSSPKSDSSEGRGFNRMMSMVNGSRLGVAAMGLGIARRCFLEASIYAAQREAFGRRLDGLPLVQETLLGMAVEVEAAAAVVFEASSLAGRHGDEEARRLYRIMVPLSKFRAARRGLEVASQAGGPRRQRLHRELAPRPAVPRRPVPHDLGGRGEHHLPGRPPLHRQGAGPRRPPRARR